MSDNDRHRLTRLTIRMVKSKTARLKRVLENPDVREVIDTSSLLAECTRMLDRCYARLAEVEGNSASGSV